MGAAGNSEGFGGVGLIRRCHAPCDSACHHKVTARAQRARQRGIGAMPTQGSAALALGYQADASTGLIRNAIFLNALRPGLVAAAPCGG